MTQIIWVICVTGHQACLSRFRLQFWCFRNLVAQHSNGVYVIFEDGLELDNLLEPFVRPHFSGLLEYISRPPSQGPSLSKKPSLTWDFRPDRCLPVSRRWSIRFRVTCSGQRVGGAAPVKFSIKKHVNRVANLRRSCCSGSLFLPSGLHLVYTPCDVNIVFNRILLANASTMLV